VGGKIIVEHPSQPLALRRWFFVFTLLAWRRG